MTKSNSEKEWLTTSIGASTADAIHVRGHDLANDLMGQMSFADVAFLLSAGRRPTAAESVVFNAVLVSLADHGLTPTVLAARLTYTGAPEALQGAVAAGLLGAGRVFLGPVEDTAHFLAAILAGVPSSDRSELPVLRRAAAGAVAGAVADGRRIPGLGHPIHRESDPRTARLYELARGAGVEGPHLTLLALVASEHQTATGKALPINGAGAAGAALADLGFRPSIVRGFALLARTAGLIAHLEEEEDHPIGMRLWKEVEGRASSPPTEESR